MQMDSLWGTIPAWVSLVLAAIALIQNHRTRRELRAGERHARIRAELRNDVAHQFWRLYLVNEGKAEARNVRVTLNGAPLEQWQAAIGGLPSLIGGNGQVSCIMAFSQACSPPLDCQVQWDDDAGKNHMYRTTLTY